MTKKRTDQIPTTEVNIKDIFVPKAVKRAERDLERDYQRPAKKIEGEYNHHLCEPLHVARRSNGRFACVDGQHRWLRMRAEGFDTILVIDHGLIGVQAEAKLFIDLQNKRNRLSGEALFFASVVEKNPLSVEIHKFMQGQRVKPTRKAQELIAGTTERVPGAKCGIELLRETILTLSNAQPGITRPDASMVRAVAIFYAYHPEADRTVLTEALSDANAESRNRRFKRLGDDMLKAGVQRDKWGTYTYLALLDLYNSKSGRGKIKARTFKSVGKALGPQ